MRPDIEILTTVDRHDQDRKHIIKQLKIILEKILLVITRAYTPSQPNRREDLPASAEAIIMALV